MKYLPNIHTLSHTSEEGAQTEVTVRVISDSLVHAKEITQNALEMGVSSDAFIGNLKIEKMESADSSDPCPNFDYEVVCTPFRTNTLRS